MTSSDLIHWQDSEEDIQRCNEVFKRFEAAGLLDDLSYVIKKVKQNTELEVAYDNSDFSGNS